MWTFRKTATVKIGRFELKLAALPKCELFAARKAWHALVVAQLAPVASKPWCKAHDDALGFVFLSARQNNRRLRLADLDDEAEPQEVVEAFKAFSKLMRARYGKLWEAPGDGSGDSN